MPKVSVIVPVYNVAPYVEKCARSLFAQNLEDMEFIFVDDCSPDRSIQIIKQVLEDYPIRHGQVRFLKNEKNLGLGGTRANGLKNATGEYVIHCDSDDWVEPVMYEQLYEKAKEQNADIVTCDYYQEYPDKVVVSKRGSVSIDPRNNLLNTESRPCYSCWSHLVNRDVIFKNNIFPVQGVNMWEDILMMMRIYYYANKIEYIKQPLYHYNKCNINSITLKNTFSDINLEQQKQCVEILEEFFADKMDIDFTNTALMLKKMIKDRYLLQTPPNFKKWRACYPESANVKVAFQHTNWKYDFVYALARIGILWPMRIYYKYFHVYYP